MIVNLDTSQPFHIAYANGEEKLIVNRDETHQILVGKEQGSVYEADPDTFIIDPLGSAAVSGDYDYWGIALSGTPQIAVMPGATQWSPSPAQIATQISLLGLMKDTTGQSINTTAAGIPAGIAASGAPLLRLSNVLLNQATGTLAVNAGSGQIYNGPATQISFELTVNAINAASATLASFLHVIVQHVDSASGVVLFTQQYSMGAGPAGGNGHTISLSGPCKADTLKVALYNSAHSNDSVTYTCTVVASSVPYQTDRMESTSIGGIAGFTSPSFNIQQGILASAQAVAVAAGASAQYVLPMYSGLVQLCANSTSGSSNLVCTFYAIDANAISYPLYVQRTDGQGRIDSGPIMLNRYQCYLDLNNGGSAAQTLTFALEEYDPRV